MQSRLASVNNGCPLAKSPGHDVHLQIMPILDALQFQLTQLQWKVAERRKRGLLGPIIDEDDKLDPPDLIMMVDTISMDLNKTLVLIDDQIKHLQSRLVEHVAGYRVDDLSSCRCEIATFSGSLTELDDSFPKQDSLFVQAMKHPCLHIAKVVKEKDTQVNEVIRRRSPYRHTYTCAYHASFPRPENNSSLPIYLERTKGARTQTIAFDSTKYVDQSIIRRSIDPILCPNSKKFSFIPGKSVSQILAVAEKFEKSLQGCSKYPYSIVGASRLVKNMTLVVDHLSVVSTLTAENGVIVEAERKFDRSMNDWDDSLKSLEDYSRHYLSKSRVTTNGSLADTSPVTLPFHSRAKIFCHDKDSEDSKTFCERENITLANIGSRITHAYRSKILFDGFPMDEVVVVGTGSYGNVYKVTLPISQKFIVNVDTFGGEEARSFTCEKVAVKKTILSPSLSDVRACSNILLELETRVVLRHESILPLIGLWSNFDDDDLNYPLLVSPWMDDGDLHHFIEYHPETSVLARLIFLRDVASALAYMHEYHDVEFVHGDLKADNVLVHEGRAYLHDFGKARILGEDEGLRTRNPSGNWRWQAPELLDRFRRDKPAYSVHATPQSDMYAYGSLFLEVMTGEYPWDAPEAFQYRVQNRSKIEKRPDRIKDDRHWLLMKHCWMEEPTLRLTAERALMALEKLVTEAQLKDK
ncbi:hypothetical protein ACEPAG_3867 [Sanghuangporus baumii]